MTNYSEQQYLDSRVNQTHLSDTSESEFSEFGEFVAAPSTAEVELNSSHK